jgi:hypothetical protein
MKTALATFLMLIGTTGYAAVDSGQNSCLTCHSTIEDERLQKPAKLFDGDVHHQAGLTCADCHGGDPKNDSMDAMSPAKGFKESPRKPPSRNSARAAMPTPHICIASTPSCGLIS